MNRIIPFTLLFLFLVSCNSYKNYTASNVLEVEQMLVAHEITDFKWVSYEEINEKSKKYVNSDFFIRYFNENQSRLLPNKDLPGCIGYTESLLFQDLSLTDFDTSRVKLYHYFNNNILEGGYHGFSCLISLPLTKKRKCRKKLGKMIQLIEADSNLDIKVIMLEVNKEKPQF